MTKKIFYLCVFFFGFQTLQAQTTDSLPPKLDPKTRAAINASDLAVYQLALRYNDLNVAKSKLYELILRNPNNIQYAEYLASMYFEMGQSSSAALVALDILEGNDKNLVALEIAAYSLEALGALDRSLPHFESLHLLTGESFPLYKTAFLQYSLKRYQEALNSANMLIKNAKADEKIGFPKSPTETQEVSMKAAALNLKGMIYMDQGSKEEARVAFQEAIQLDAEFETAKENLQKLNQ
ncbi:tetratricopeptide repeat protein [Algoriphagus namhaensis]